MSNRTNSFTLIEILVVVGIMVIIMGLLTVSINNVQIRSRDTKRKSDLRSIAQALELYRQDQSPIAYPANGTFIATKDACWSSAAGCTGNIYMKKTPVDPDSTGTVTYAYSYSVNNSVPSFTLCACLENSNDPEAKAGNCSDRTCTSGFNYTLESQ